MHGGPSQARGGTLQRTRGDDILAAQTLLEMIDAGVVLRIDPAQVVPLESLLAGRLNDAPLQISRRKVR